MNNVLRSIYLFLPFLLTLIALILLIIVNLDQQYSSSSFLTSLYFFRIDTSGSTFNVAGINIDVDKVAGLKAFYDVGLWNYCTGDDPKGPVLECSTRQASYWFNPFDVWAGGPLAEKLVSDDWHKALNTYQSVAKWLFAAYLIATIATALTLLLGILSFFMSRVTTFITALAADISAFFAIAASATAIGLYVTIAGIIDTKLNKYGIKTDVGKKVLSISCLAALMITIAAIFWTCGCCCGHDRREPKRQRSVRGKSAYERLPSPFGGHQRDQSKGDEVPLQQTGPAHWPGDYHHGQYHQPQFSPQTPQPQHMGTGYEPYRGGDYRV